MFDLLIVGGRIVDGSGNPWYYGDVGVQGGRIAAVGRLEGAEARRTISAAGMAVCPGFIDVHRRERGRRAQHHGLRCSHGGQRQRLRGRQAAPAAHGCYPRFLGRYVRELGILRLEDCVRKMASFPAARLKLADRGLVKKGLAADIVVFDPATVLDSATYEDSFQFPTGIEFVVVNGEIVVDEGKHTGHLPGRALRPGSSIGVLA